MSRPRYALYYAPAEDCPLDRLASEWLGRSAYSQRQYRPSGLGSIGPADQEAMTAEPRRYGFHATLKPPFALRQGSSPDELLHAAEAFAAGRSPVVLDGLHTAAIGRFVALVPKRRSKPLEALAADCVRAFDGFRAPAGEAELSRRRARGLTSRQERLLRRWGYPYVMEEFRFHLTLTGPLPDELRAAVAATLAKTFDPPCDSGFVVDSLSVFAQREPGAAFTAIERFPFGGGNSY